MINVEPRSTVMIIKKVEKIVQDSLKYIFLIRISVVLKANFIIKPSIKSLSLFYRKTYHRHNDGYSFVQCFGNPSNERVLNELKDN